MGTVKMDPAVEKVHLKKLQEIILDDDQIYTVRLAAFELNITIQEAEVLLEKFIETTNQSEQLACTYILTGPLKKSGNKGVILAKDDDLHEKRLLFEKVESQVLCSVQKSKNIDLNQVCTIDCPNKTGDTALPGLIISKNCGKRTITQCKKLPSPVKSVNLAGPSKAPIKLSEDKTDTQTKAKSSNNILTNFFNNAPKTTSPNKKAVKSKPKGGLSEFFAKSRDNNIKQEKEKVIPKEPVEEKMDIVIVDDESEIKEEIPQIKKESKAISKSEELPPKTKSKPPKSKNGNKRVRAEADTPPNKKRKRIIKIIDSDSDDMFENDENSMDDIIESDNECKAVTVPVKSFESKNRKRKAVDKTYEDEEGFIITKTEYVYETASEDENEEPPKNEIKPKEKTEVPSKGKNIKNGPKKPAAANGKQTTLLGFFNKK